jgi:hypothetical protein
MQKEQSSHEEQIEFGVIPEGRCHNFFFLLIIVQSLGDCGERVMDLRAFLNKKGNLL